MALEEESNKYITTSPILIEIILKLCDAPETGVTWRGFSVRVEESLDFFAMRDKTFCQADDFQRKEGGKNEPFT